MTRSLPLRNAENIIFQKYFINGYKILFLRTFKYLFDIYNLQIIYNIGKNYSSKKIDERKQLFMGFSDVLNKLIGRDILGRFLNVPKY